MVIRVITNEIKFSLFILSFGGTYVMSTKSDLSLQDYVEVTGQKTSEKFTSKCIHFPSAKHKSISWGNLISPEDQGHKTLWVL